MQGEEVGFYGGKGSDTVHLVRFFVPLLRIPLHKG